MTSSETHVREFFAAQRFGIVNNAIQMEACMVVVRHLDDTQTWKRLRTKKMDHDFITYLEVMVRVHLKEADRTLAPHIVAYLYAFAKHDPFAFTSAEESMLTDSFRQTTQEEFDRMTESDEALGEVWRALGPRITAKMKVELRKLGGPVNDEMVAEFERVTGIVNLRGKMGDRVIGLMIYGADVYST